MVNGTFWRQLEPSLTATPRSFLLMGVVALAVVVSFVLEAQG